MNGRNCLKGEAENIYLCIPFKKVAKVTVSLPFFSLFFCLFSSLLFKYEESCMTECGADNFIPSISAVTGSSPERYVWRFCLGLHSTPRYAVAFVYYNFFISRAHFVHPRWQTFYKRLARVEFWINVIENTSLLGVTFISNKDNYPLHEKIFVVFMFSSCICMLMILILMRMSRDPSTCLTPTEEFSWKWKKYFFIAILTSTAGLLYFFYFHFLYCLPNAFSYFSICEYLIAVTNMGFHVTAMYDFEDLNVVIGRLSNTRECGILQSGVEGKMNGGTKHFDQYKSE